MAMATQWRAPRPPPSPFHFSATGSALSGSLRASGHALVVAPEVIGPVVERVERRERAEPLRERRTCAAAGNAATSTNSKGKAWRGNNMVEKNRAAAILTR